MNKHRYQIIQLLLITFLISGCTGNTQPTRYYTLTAQSDSSALETALDHRIALGVGPLVLPEILDRSGIVSYKNENELNVAGYHIWAGELHDTFIRVLTDNLSSQLNLDSVWSFPWDNRNRPKYQLRVIVEEFSGKLGQNATLRAKWSILGDFGRTELMTRRSKLQASTNGSGYANYVGALNQLVGDFSQQIAEQISSTLQSQASDNVE